MIGSFLTRALALVLGYAYPAYECFKTVELNKPEIEQLRFWCQYWILVAALTVFERVGESFISWLPMYSEAKVAFFVYLWYPKTRGTAYVYETFFRPYVSKHETEIDRNLLELRTRAGDMVVLYSQRIASYGQTRFFEILQYVASQSPSQSTRPRPAQQRQEPLQQSQQVRPTAPTTATRQPAVSQQPQHLTRQPPPPASPSKSPLQEPTKIAASSSAVTVPPAAQSQSLAKTASLPSSSGQPPSLGKAASLPSSLDTVSSASSPDDADKMQVEVASAILDNKQNPPPPQETPMEEAIRVTRGRLRKRAAAGGS
ncbi:HVA22-like protein i [Asparagus officinalis]|uniref:HVA22-like protein i n=1 Tax=Asparagus officinalis TaxID=4686 RepID=UPI00098E39C1|nr:HVA22-like protein i [Asparagus officinalis]